MPMIGSFYRRSRLERTQMLTIRASMLRCSCWAEIIMIGGSASAIRTVADQLFETVARRDVAGMTFAIIGEYNIFISLKTHQPSREVTASVRSAVTVG